MELASEVTLPAVRQKQHWLISSLTSSGTGDRSITRNIAAINYRENTVAFVCEHAYAEYNLKSKVRINLQ